MSGTESRGARLAVSRLVLRLFFFHAIVAGIFLVYLWLLTRSETAIRWAALAAAAGTLAACGAVLLLATWIYLAPVREALGAPRDAALAARACRRAGRAPPLGAAATFLFWLAGGLAVRAPLAGGGLPADVVSAGILAAACTGLVSTLLYYYVATSDLFPARALLAGAQAPARGGSIGLRIIVTSAAVLLVGVSSVGVTAFLNHRLALERATVTACERALKALVVIEAPTAAIVDAAAKACGGPAAVAIAGRVLSSVGEERIVDLPEGRGPRGVLLTMPLRSGTTLYVLVNDRSWGEGGSTFAASMAAFAVMALLLSLFVALVASQSITAPIRGLVEGAEAIARGDLSREVPVLTRDEIGSLAGSFATMRSGLQELVGNIHGAAESLSAQVSSVVTAGALVQRGAEVRQEGVAGVTREMTEMDRSVAAVGRDIGGLNEYVATTGAALAQFAASLEEVRRHGAELQRALAGSRGEVTALLQASDGVKREVAALAEAARSTLSTIGESGRLLRALADTARDGERVAGRLFDETRSGLEVVEESVRGVEAIRGMVAEARERVETLGMRSGDITAVVDFIADVAGRTNLLSLNAAIIAAQAGEQGKPFGVVADQIRELAAQIGVSTKRIADIIAGVHLEVEATSGLISQSDELAAAGVERAREAGLALRRIAEESKRAREVSAAILPVVTSYTQTARQIEHLAARVVEMAQGFEGVELLARGGRSIESLSQSLEPLTMRVGRALEEQAIASHRQVQSLEEITRMIARLDHTVCEHGEGTARVLRGLGALATLADEDRRAVDELAHAAQALTRHAQVLREGLEQFRI